MAIVSDVVATVNRLAPFRSAYLSDPVGLQVGDPDAPVAKAVVSLDRSWDAIKRCIDTKADMLVCHHPLIFRPLTAATPATPEGRAVLELASHRIAFLAAHTNWDCAKGGVNDELARLLGLGKVIAFGDSGPSNETKLVTFAPVDAADRVIDALSAARAGHIGNYRRCAFYGPGKGTFEPGPSAQPYTGRPGQKETVDEWRIEMVVPNEKLPEAVQALRKAHPYEEPAFDLIPLADTKPWPIGRIGALNPARSLKELVQQVNEALQTQSMAWGDREQVVERVAVCGGSGADLWRAAKQAGADLLVTGECPQHVALEASDSGFAIVSSGHYATENPGAKALQQKLGDELPDIEWEFFEPRPGSGGRPVFLDLDH